MSRIFEALKHAQAVRAARDKQAAPVPLSVESPDRRGSRRMAMDIGVYVYGHGPGTVPFHEEAHTLRVNAGGALLLLSVPVEQGQQLLLTNTLTEQEQPCRVVYLGTRRTRTIEAGVAFTNPNPDFWPIPASTPGPRYARP